jgi:Flp pilus assembly protein TadD
MELNAPDLSRNTGTERGARGRASRHASLILAIAAATILGACSASDHSERQPSLRVADAALASGAPEMALHVADLVLARHPGDAAALTARGDALYALGHSDTAREAYRAAIAADPRAAGAQVGLGRTLARSDPAAAEAALLAALALQPDNVVALNNLGVVRDLQGRNAEAQEAYGRALSIAPESADVRINLGTSLAVSGRHAAAARLLREVAAGPDAARAWSKELLAGLTIAGDGAWARMALQAEPGPREPAVAPSGRVAAAVVASVDDGAAQSANAAPVAVAARIPETAVATVPAGIRLPASQPSAVRVAGDMPPVAIRPIVTDTNRVANTPLARPVAAATLAGVGAVASAAAVPRMETQVAVARPAPPSVGVTGETAETGPYVQLASVLSEEDAMFEWRRLNGRLSEVLAGHEPAVTPADVHGRPFWRLRTFGFASFAEANELCEELKTAGLRCFSRSGL